jgi:hypothetical protein
VPVGVTACILEANQRRGQQILLLMTYRGFLGNSIL